MEARSASSIRREALGWLPIECFASNGVRDGRARWPEGIRLLDLLNSLYATRYDSSSGEFLDFVDVSDEGDAVETHVNKIALTMVAVGDEDVGRGIGATGERSFPFVPKSVLPVSVETDTFTVDGSMHLADGETVQDILNQDTLFLPITRATLVTRERHFFASRPFVAVNKRHIISVQVGRPLNS